MKKKLVLVMLSALLVGVMCGCTNKNSGKKNDTKKVIKIPDGLDTKQQDLSKLSYSKSFAVLMAKIKKDYGIAEVKGLDADEFYSEHLETVKKAEKEKDETSYYRVLFDLQDMLGEAHASVSNREAASASLDYYAGNDYGLSMIGMTDGRTVAIDVEKDSEAYKAGIRNGTVITSWDGRKIDEWREETDVKLPSLLVIPVKASKEIFKPFFIASKGGDKVTVSFETENGEEKEVKLAKIGGYSKRLNEVLDLFQNRQRNNQKVNFGWKILEGNQGYIVINSARVTTKDSSSYPEWSSKIKTAVEKMKKEKVKNLILDLRNNVGGEGLLSKVIASLFADKEYSFASLKNGDSFSEMGPVEANNIWKDVNIVVLVNSLTMSNGDLLTYTLGKLPNVTLMGTTTSNSSLAIAGGNIQMTDNMSFVFPDRYVYDENGEYLIVTPKDGESAVVLDEQIVIDEKFVEQVFEKEADYELDYCCEYIDKTFGKSEVQRKAEYVPATGGANKLPYAYMAFMSGDVRVRYFEDGNDYSPIVSKGVKIKKDGSYTVGLDFSSVWDGYVEGMTFSGILINDCEIKYPKSTLTLEWVKINGKKVKITGKEYTTSDDGKVTRINLVNPWVTNIPDDARRADGDLKDVSPVIIDDKAVKKIKTIEAKFKFEKNE